jgi:CDP-2,3-bis-(O-geranylgeranyl)-sn-glycerol synthase
MHLLREIFFALWFFLPAGIANVMPIFAAHVSRLKPFDAPMDFGKSFRGKRIFGAHKTWRGMVAGIIFGTITLALQQVVLAHAGWLRDWTHQVNYAQLSTLVVGPLFAIGALGGDAIESFFKRQRGIAPGHGWFPFDQIDYIVGGALATMPFVKLSVLEYALLVGIWLVVHVVASIIGYCMGIKERPI